MFVFDLNVSFATDFDYSAAITYTSYDNINHELDPLETETSQSVLLDMVVLEDSSEINVSLAAAMEAINYSNNLVDDRVVGSLAMNSIWRIKPEHFEWHISDVYTQTRVDINLPDTPDNEQNVNAFSTGPNYLINFDKNNTLIFEPRFMSFYYENADIDNSRISNAIRYNHIISSTIELNLDYSYQNVKYRDELFNTNYLQQDLSSSFLLERRALQAILELGLTQINPDNAPRYSESIYRLNIVKQINTSSFFSFEINHQLSDIGLSLLDIEPGEPVPAFISNVNADVYIQDLYLAEYERDLRNGDLLVGLSSIRSEYVNLAEYDIEEKRFEISRNWDLSGISSVLMSAQIAEISYINQSPFRQDTNSVIRLEYTYNARRNIDVIFETIKEIQNSNIDSFEFEDFTMQFTLVYFTE